VDLRHSEADETFRREFRQWLDESLSQSMQGGALWSRSGDANAAFELRRDWERSKADAGWAGIQWPREYGGYGGTPAQKAIHDEEMAKARAPRSVNSIGLAFLGPTLMVFGTEEQKSRHIGPLLHNDVIWCQGFSEPGAGSDLAALQTKAVREGDELVVSGQKVWTSNATHADWMFALVRTNAEGAKHHGITFLLLDMRSPGVEVRPLKQMSGASEFGEVFFTDVRVPIENVVGEIDSGWKVAMALLAFERGASAIGYYTEFRRELDELVELARTVERGGRPAAQDPTLRQKLAQSVIELELLKLHSLHVLTQVEQGRDLGAEASMTKLQWSEAHQHLGETFMDVTGPSSQLATPWPGLDISTQQEQFLWSRSETIWGGSSQVQRTIVAERVLGLPR